MATATAMAPAVATPGQGDRIADGLGQQLGAEDRQTAAPRAPPARPSTEASSRNWRRMSDGLGAQGLAEADLPDPFGDRDQHDVHDPDAADQQRDAGDAAEQDGEGPVHRGRGRDQRRLRCDGEVGVGRGGDVVQGQQLGVGLLVGGGRVAPEFGLDEDRAERGCRRSAGWRC